MGKMWGEPTQRKKIPTDMNPPDNHETSSYTELIVNGTRGVRLIWPHYCQPWLSRGIGQAAEMVLSRRLQSLFQSDLTVNLYRCDS